MSKKSAILIILLVILTGTAVLYFLIGGKTPSSLPIFNGSPFGNAPEESVGTSTDSGDTNAGEGEVGEDVLGNESNTKNPLVKLSMEPVAGAVSFTKNGSTYVRYVDRATGHVEEIKLSTLEKTKILNITRPKVYEVLWRKDGKGYIERTLNQSDESVTNISISLVAPKASSTDSLYTASSTLLSGDVASLNLVNDNTIIYNLKETGVISIAGFSGEKPKTLVSLPYSSWRFIPQSTTTALIQTKPSILAQGYAYSLNLSNGSMTKILGPFYGLSLTPNNDTSRLAFSYRVGNKNVLSVKNVKTNTQKDILPTTFSDKCVWSRKLSSNLYCGIPKNGMEQSSIDTWYKGQISFEDKIWKFNTETDTAEVIFDPKEGMSESVDVTNPMLSPDEDYLIFINKNDLSLWALKLVP